MHRALADYCVAAVAPHPHDAPEAFFGIDPDELEGVVEELFEELGLPRPSPQASEYVPPLATALDLACYLSRRCAAPRIDPASSGER